MPSVLAVLDEKALYNALFLFLSRQSLVRLVLDPCFIPLVSPFNLPCYMLWRVMEIISFSSSLICKTLH